MFISVISGNDLSFTVCVCVCMCDHSIIYIFLFIYDELLITETVPKFKESILYVTNINGIKIIFFLTFLSFTMYYINYR